MKKISLVFFVAFAFLFLLKTKAIANFLGGSEWSVPQLISNPGMPAYQPDLVSDPYGRVHVIWVELTAAESGCNYDTVMYSYYYQGNWSTPADILVSPVSPYCAAEPALAYSFYDNHLHLVWYDYRLYYSSSVADTAFSAGSWTEPVIIDAVAARRPDIVVDSIGRIHVAYYRDQPYWDVYYTRSDDGGQNWLPPVLIHEALPQYRIDRIDIAVDDRDRIHVVWFDELKDGVNERGGTIFYTRSTDHGESWNMPFIVEDKGPDYTDAYGPGEINVTTSGGDRVFLVWAGAPSSQRWYQWSEDGGETWSAPELVAPMDIYDGAGLRNYNEGMDMAADSAGQIHLVSSGSGRFTHMVWQDGIWYGPDEILTFEPVWSRITILNGNDIFVVGAFTEKFTQLPASDMRIWVMRLNFGTPFVPSLQMQEMALVDNLAETEQVYENTPALIPTTPWNESIDLEPEWDIRDHSLIAVVAGIAPVMLLIVFLLAVKRVRGDR
ncbi:MAG: exo-alpha-sialidase [Anaerolineales bacterium]|nr:exo-alpha-sialidase [Anaerolineales bacterium]